MELFTLGLMQSASTLDQKETCLLRTLHTHFCTATVSELRSGNSDVNNRLLLSASFSWFYYRVLSTKRCCCLTEASFIISLQHHYEGHAEVYSQKWWTHWDTRRVCLFSGLKPLARLVGCSTATEKPRLLRWSMIVCGICEDGEWDRDSGVRTVW